jgi:hypothetical protein
MNFALNFLRTVMLCMSPKGVTVRPYVRVRFGNLENVRGHCRSYPGQLELFH